MAISYNLFTNLFVTLSLGAVRSTEKSMCACGSVHNYLRNHTAKLHKIFVACIHSQSSSCSIAIHCVLPVLWMISCFHIMGTVAPSRICLQLDSGSV